MKSKDLLFGLILSLTLLWATATNAAQKGWIAAQGPGEAHSVLVGSTGRIDMKNVIKGTQATLFTDVNLRHKPAEFRQPIAILKAGTTITVAELKNFPTPLGPQLWLRVVAKDTASVPKGDLVAVPQGIGLTDAGTAAQADVPINADYAAACKAELARQIAAQPANTPPDERDIFYDQDGLIVHRQDDGSCDGGDTAQREGWYWLGVWLRQHTSGMQPWTKSRRLNFHQVLQLLEPRGNGVIYRHPKLSPWNDPFSKEWGTSRDQLTPMIAAMGVWGESDALHRLWAALPYDLVGKHAFNGNWRNFLGQDGWDCTSLKQVDCSPQGDCSVRQDNRSCDLQTDGRDCSLQVDNRDCSLQEDTRDCEVCVIPNIFTGGCSQRGHDLACEASKKAQNVIYAGNKAACEASKTTQNTLYATQKAACETSKSTQNGLYATQKIACESGKTSQNVMYAGEKGLCEAAKSGGKAACEVAKEAKFQLCRIGNVYSGDILGPETVNMFRRSLGENPLIPSPDDLLTIIGSGAAGEAEGMANTLLRIRASADLNDVGDDLNHIVALLVAERRFPSALTATSALTYAAGRHHSYGSYLGEYQQHYGADYTDIERRITAGIAAGWKPDSSVIYGAIRWYHRPSSGANPLLAKLYEPIIAWYFYGPGLVH